MQSSENKRSAACSGVAGKLRRIEWRQNKAATHTAETLHARAGTSTAGRLVLHAASAAALTCTSSTLQSTGPRLGIPCCTVCSDTAAGLQGSRGRWEQVKQEQEEGRCALQCPLPPNGGWRRRQRRLYCSLIAQGPRTHPESAIIHTLQWRARAYPVALFTGACAKFAVTLLRANPVHKCCARHRGVNDHTRTTEGICAPGCGWKICHRRLSQRDGHSSRRLGGHQTLHLQERSLQAGQSGDTKQTNSVIAVITRTRQVGWQG